MPPNLDALFKPRSVAFVGGRNLAPVLEYHRALGFAGDTWVVNPTHAEVAGYPCLPSAAALPQAPDLAFVAIRSAAAVDAVAALRERGCKAVICHAGGFAETGAAALQDALVQAADGMALLGPNSMGLVNYADPMAATMDNLGVMRVQRGVAICAQAGGFMCDVVFSDRDLPVTHLIGAGNQAVINVAHCAEHLLDDARVTAVGLSFEGMRDVAALRRAAAKALRLGKPMVAIKFGRTPAGAQAAATHTASMAGEDAAWEALFDRLGILSTRCESEFLETLKLLHSGKIPKGRRALVAAASGVMGVMLADHLSAAGLELPQPSAACAARLRGMLPEIATPANPQDVTMMVWNDFARQSEIYAALLDEGYDMAVMVQNYPHKGMWDIGEYDAQVDALGAACAGREVAGMQLAPLAECFPAAARAHTRELGLVPMQGIEECARALAHAVCWRERRAALQTAGLASLEDAPPPPAAAVAAAAVRVDEAAAKQRLAAAGIAVPEMRVAAADDAQAVAAAAAEIGFPVVLKALHADLLHKSEVGAVRIGLNSAAEVAAALAQMRSELQRHAPQLAFSRVLVEAMVADSLAEVMASVSSDASVGAVMLLAAGGEDAELWNDSTLLAAPFSRAEIARALQRLKIAKRLRGWRGKPPADVPALLDLLENLASFAAAAEGEGVAEVELNPIIVGRCGACAADAVLRLAAPSRQTRVK